MNKAHFENERLYQSTIAVARTMASRGIITADELAEIDHLLLQKYNPLLGGLGNAKAPESLAMCGNQAYNQR